MKLKHKLNLYRRYPYWNKQNIIFIHIPKAAGTSINNAIYGRTLGHYSAAEVQGVYPRLFERSFVFSFVRNPWGRLLSAYRFAKQGRTKFMGMNNPEQYQIPEFESFEKFIFEWLEIQDISKLDFVFRPQHPFLLNEQGQIIVDFIGQVEQMEVDWRTVESMTGKALSISHSNRTSDPLFQSFHDAYISNEMIDSVAKIYSKDIKLLGYEFQ